MNFRVGDAPLEYLARGVCLLDEAHERGSREQPAAVVCVEFRLRHRMEFEQVISTRGIEHGFDGGDHIVVGTGVRRTRGFGIPLLAKQYPDRHGEG